MFSLLSDITCDEANWMDYFTNSSSDVTYCVAKVTLTNDYVDITWNWNLWPMTKFVCSYLTMTLSSTNGNRRYFVDVTIERGECFRWGRKKQLIYVWQVWRTIRWHLMLDSNGLVWKTWNIVHWLQSNRTFNSRENFWMVTQRST